MAENMDFSLTEASKKHARSDNSSDIILEPPKKHTLIGDNNTDTNSFNLEMLHLPNQDPCPNDKQHKHKIQNYFNYMEQNKLYVQVMESCISTAFSLLRSADLSDKKKPNA